jgi:xanthine dehydrogenase YagS FAD-binding subunit
MRPFTYTTAQSANDAVNLGMVQADAHVRLPVQFLAGGATLIDLMKIDVMQPSTLVGIKRIQDPALRRIEVNNQGLRIGALVSMAEAAAAHDCRFVGVPIGRQVRFP